MKMLVIPDIHLKSWMFDDADKILRDKKADRAVVLGDIVDDFGCDGDCLSYERTLKRALKFQKDHPNTLWCKGNHDMAYLWSVPCSGTSRYNNVQDAAIKGLCALYDEAGRDNVAFVHKIDSVLFSHAGVSRMFVREHRGSAGYDNEDGVIKKINDLRRNDMWYDDSPIWLRPQACYAGFRINMYKPKKLLQVVGHSPMKRITQEGNMISCDTFSTYRDGTPYGNEEFCVLDTLTWDWQSVPSSRIGAIAAFAKYEQIENIFKKS